MIDEAKVAGNGFDLAAKLATANVPWLLVPALAATGLAMASALGEENAVARVDDTALKGVIKKWSPPTAPALAVMFRPSIDASMGAVGAGT